MAGNNRRAETRWFSVRRWFFSFLFLFLFFFWFVLFFGVFEWARARATKKKSSDQRGSRRISHEIPTRNNSKKKKVFDQKKKEAALATRSIDIKFAVAPAPIKRQQKKIPRSLRATLFYGRNATEWRIKFHTPRPPDFSVFFWLIFFYASRIYIRPFTTANITTTRSQREKKKRWTSSRNPIRRKSWLNCRGGEQKSQQRKWNLRLPWQRIKVEESNGIFPIRNLKTNWDDFFLKIPRAPDSVPAYKLGPKKTRKK